MQQVIFLQVPLINLPGQVVMEPEMSAPLWEAKTTQMLEAMWVARSTQAFPLKVIQDSLAQVC